MFFTAMQFGIGFQLSPSLLILSVVGVYLVLINLITFALYGADKRRAKQGKWRITERTLITCCFLGGAAGGMLGMKVFRHKTQHTKFRILVPVSLVLWTALVICFLVFMLRSR